MVWDKIVKLDELSLDIPLIEFAPDPIIKFLLNSSVLTLFVVDHPQNHNTIPNTAATNSKSKTITYT